VLRPSFNGESLTLVYKTWSQYPEIKKKRTCRGHQRVNVSPETAKEGGESYSEWASHRKGHVLDKNQQPEVDCKGEDIAKRVA